MSKTVDAQSTEGGANPTSPLQLHLKRITKQEARLCMEKWHYLGKKDFISSYNYGVFLNDTLYGCISFGPPSAWEVVYGILGTKEQSGVFEIKRLALSDELPKNSESRVIGVAIKLLRKETPVRAIVTYADSSVGHIGTIYKATGFKYLGLTAPKKDFYVNGKIKERGKTRGVDGVWIPRPRKHKFVKIFE